MQIKESTQSFYIAAKGPSTRPRRTLKHDDCFAILDSHGDIGATPGVSDGLYFKDTRYLRHLELLLDGMQLLLLGSATRDDNALFTVDLTNPDVYDGSRLVLPKNVLHFVRTFFLWRGAVYQRVRIQNYSAQAINCTVSISFASDFADLFEVRGAKRSHRGKLHAAITGDEQVTIGYEGLDKKTRYTVLSFEPAPDRLEPNFVSYSLAMGPDETCWLYATAECLEDIKTELPAAPFRKSLLGARRQQRTITRGAASVFTNNSIFNEVLCRSMADLRMLATDTPQGLYPYAGIPWYSTTFGRDGIITAIQMLWCYPELARGVLSRLAALQAVASDPAADAEPGKILHELRSGEMAELNEVPFRQYYGSVDSTPLFVLLAGLYVERTGDVDLLAKLWPNIEAALNWIDGAGDPDGDGFVEYYRRNEEGLINQGWKDSHDSISHADGELAGGPIALCEVQAYVYAAKRAIAECARRLGKPRKADALDDAADQLVIRFDEAFYCPDLGTYALALDGNKQRCGVRASNAGHVLFGGLASQERADAVVRTLMQKSSFSGWGIRTLATDEVRYNPMSYHNGSIWPHDNALIAMGFARYGHKTAVGRLFEALFGAASYMDLRRLPELYCGFRRGRGQGPTLYPVACSPQAWAAGAPFLMLQASLGLEIDCARHEMILRNPQLPRFLEMVTLTNLQVGGHRVALRIHRDGASVSIKVLRNEGAVRITAICS